MDRTRILRGILAVAALLSLTFGLEQGTHALQTVPAGNLVGHWPLDSGVSPNPDVGGAPANDATLVAAPTVTPGVFGTALAFNGTSQSLSIPNEATLDMASGSYSVAMWIKPTNVANIKRMFNKWSTTGNGKGILFDINGATGGGDAAGNLRFRISDGTRNLDYSQPAGFRANQWYHIAGVIDRTVAPGHLRIYVNGRQLGTNQNLPAGTTDVTVTDEIQIGELNGANYYAGAIDEVVYYSRALSRSELETLTFGGFTSIGVGNPAPVVPEFGLLATYFTYPNGAATPPGSIPGSPDNTPPTQANCTPFLTRLDFNMDQNFVTVPPPGSPNGSNYFMTLWEGSIVIPATGDYRFFVSSDDGERSWFGDVTATTPNLDFWVQRGVVTDTYPAAADINLPAGTLDTRIEFEQGNGGASLRLDWRGPPAAAQIVIPGIYLRPPPGPNAPGGLTATATANSPTPQVVVTWNASTLPIPATSYILSRATAPGGPYTQVAVQPGLTFTDTTVAFGTTYYYIVQGTAANGLLVGPASANTGGSTPIEPALSATVAGGSLVTSEAGLNGTITIRVNVSPVGGPGNVQITSSDTTEVLLSGPGIVTPASPINLVIPAGTAVGTTYIITVHGQDDFLADGPINYNISFVVSGPVTPTNEYNTTGIATIPGTNSDNDTPGITVTQLTGPTTESFGTATFIVVFDTQPSVNTTMSVTSSNTGEATVNPANLTFTTVGSPTDPTNGWNANHVVTVTGADDAVLDFTQPFAISLSVTGGDPTYVALTSGGPIVRSGINLDNESIPTLEPVWGGGGGGGCGLTGLEAGVLLALAALLRRRFNS
jgi:hypothetical protein